MEPDRGVEVVGLDDQSQLQHTSVGGFSHGPTPGIALDPSVARTPRRGPAHLAARSQAADMRRLFSRSRTRLTCIAISY